MPRLPPRIRLTHSVVVESRRGTVRAQRPAIGYFWSLLALTAAIALRVWLDPVMGDTLPLVTLFAAVAAAIWLSGLTAAITVTIVGYVVCAYLFVPPRGELGLDSLTNQVGFAAYLLTCGLIIAFGVALRAARLREANSREVLRVTLRSIGDAVIATDVAGNVTYLNAVAESVTGWSESDAIGQPLATVFPIVNEVTRERAPNPAERALREGVVVGLANHTVLIRRDGTECPIDDSAAPIRDEHGVVSGCVLIFRDVTAQRHLEREKHNQLLTARRLASIVESSEVAIIGKRLDGTIDSWNLAAERLFGYTAAEAVGRHISLVIPPERLEEEDNIIATLKEGRGIEHFETERVRADGRRVTVSLAVSPIKDANGDVIGASKMVRDITRDRQAEAERNRLVALIESSTDFIGICNLDGTPIFINRAGLELAGLDSLDAARRVSMWDFFFREDQQRIRDELFPAVLQRGHAEIEVRFRHFKTGEARWMAYKVLTLMDEAGRPLAVGTVSQDITHRRELENDLRTLAAQLSAADQRKDEFLATLAHELRGPLAPLSNVLELWKRTADRKQLQLARETMERQLGQLVRLVDDLLDLSRVTHDRLELRKSRVELATVIEHAIEACRPIIDKREQRLSVALPKQACAVWADPARLAQVFANLLNNSSKYTDTGGQISVSAEQEDNAIVVRVRDTGIGIPADKLDSVFDMFSQVGNALDRSQGGLGIGLTLVKQLVHMHSGSVEARSAGLGKGSEFVVRLPLGGASLPASARAPAAEQKQSPSRKILVVDDNADAALSLSTLLTVSGHTTLAAHDGVSALEAAKQHRPDVVLLDIGLPQMNGREVCRRLRELPWGDDLVVIAVTGWDDEPQAWMEAGFDAHLVKPPAYEELAGLLSSLPAIRASAARSHPGS
jgi:PAS domain S-box-containing protein